MTKVERISALHYIDADHTMIDLTVHTEGGDQFPFTYVPQDRAPVTEAIRELLATRYYEIADFVPPTAEAKRALMLPLTARQLRRALIEEGISLRTVSATLAQIEDEKDREIAETEWEYASEFERTHHLIALVAKALRLSPETVDAMWLHALTT